MKKYENPEINISKFDIAVATTDSATTYALEGLQAGGYTTLDSANWETGSDWTITF